MAKRKQCVSTFGRDETSRKPKRHHWFTSSYLHWRVGDDLESTLKRQREADTRSGHEIRVFNVWRIPGDSESANYEIDNYAPQHEGAEFIGKIWYAADDKME